MGTPQNGSGLAQWAELLAKYIGLLKQTNPDIVAVLKQDSEVLARIQASFHTMIRSRAYDALHPIHITCFYEELPMPSVGVVSSQFMIQNALSQALQVVPSYSAIIPDRTYIGIRANHMEMTKFRREDDPGFIAVAEEIRRWMGEIRLGPTRLEAHESGETVRSGDSVRPSLSIIQSGGEWSGPVLVSGGVLVQGNTVGFNYG